MAGRRQVTFPVEATFKKDNQETKRWLDVNGEWVLEADNAVRFTLRTSPTPVESIRIEERIHAYFGGLQAFLDINKGLDNARAILLVEIEKKIWPDGRPQAEGKPLVAQMKKIENAWVDHSSNTMDGWVTMCAMFDRITFLAEWDVLIVDPAPGWSSLASREGLATQEVLAFQQACIEARKARSLGKEQPSKS